MKGSLWNQIGFMLSSALIAVFLLNGKNFLKPKHCLKLMHGYAQALVSEEIAAAYLEVPCIKVFLAKHCKGFTTSGPTYRVGGFGFCLASESDDHTDRLRLSSFRGLFGITVGTSTIVLLLFCTCPREKIRIAPEEAAADEPPGPAASATGRAATAAAT
ncbi:hypothetical protein Peur_065843 [Populus x canadensis]